MVKTRLILLFFILIALNCKLIHAEVIDFSISPEKPVKGDLVEIYGKTNPNEEVKVEIQFEKIIAVENGRYSFSISGLKIPEGKNRFTVTAHPCDNLKVSVKLLFNLIWITLGSEAENHTATVSQANVPAGTYDILIHGKSKQESVKLKITAIGYIKADEKGDFSYTYDTTPMPSGDFIVEIGGKRKIIKLESAPAIYTTPTAPTTTPPPPKSNSKTKTSSEDKTQPSATPTPVPTPIPTQIPAPTPHPTAIPTPTPIPSTNPKVTSEEGLTTKNESMSVEKPLPEFPKQNSSESWSSNPYANNSTEGFELIFGLLALLLVFWIKTQRK
ncbi:MAG: hypothetical protein H0Z28_09630 [Archaeoglobus sp.]|nr:hypothetical protein [Archaeoglobus sp.]